jgi:hypothetical protein
MFAPDLIFAYVVMAALFLRQNSNLKDPTKISYAPLMLSVGAIFAIVHFILYFQPENLTLILKQSSSSLLVAFLLYIVMNIIYQAQKNQDELHQREFTNAMASQILQMKEYISLLEDKIAKMNEDEQHSLYGIREDIRQDLAAKKIIQANQEKFVHKMESLAHQQDEVLHSLSKLPELDQVMHNHIDLLRVSEQDHFNRIKKAFESANQNRCDIQDEIVEIKKEVISLKNHSKEIAERIVKSTVFELTNNMLELQKDFITLKSHSEGMFSTLMEGENLLNNLRAKSETLLKQMILASGNVKDFEENSRMILELFIPLKELMAALENVRNDYQSANIELSSLAQILSSSEKEQLELMKSRVDELSDELMQKVDASLEKIHNHYHIASNEVSPTVSELAKRTKLNLYNEGKYE